MQGLHNDYALRLEGNEIKRYLRGVVLDDGDFVSVVLSEYSRNIELPEEQKIALLNVVKKINPVLIELELDYPDQIFSGDIDGLQNYLFKTASTSILKISDLFKFSDKAEREGKAQKIFDQGGVEFVASTPDQNTGKTIWEFSVKSTSGNTYPLYGETSMENPSEWIEWSDIACSCEWGRWNYDRAPDYRHLEREMCSHAIACSKWLSQNGQREQDRASREQETGMEELQFQQPTTGPRSPRPQEQFLQDKAQEKGIPQTQVKEDLQQQGLIKEPVDLNQPNRPDLQPELMENEVKEPEPPPEPIMPQPTYEEQILRPRTTLEDSPEEDDEEDDEEDKQRN
jgi:hypothetical protein